jgi:two-component system cell cycle sensor histidine kinase/response regulator CckA
MTMAKANLLRILFVEDIPSDEELAKREIRKSGLLFDSQRVDTKDAFLAALGEFHPDVIVSDYSMPEFDGMQALKLTLERDATIPFIILTGSMNEETAVKCLRAGAVDYVIKEHIASLPFAVRDALEQKKMRVAKDDAERALHESEEKFRRVVETALEGVWFLDREFKTTEVNDAVVRMLGYSPKELIGRPFVDLLLDEDRSTQAQEFQRRESGLSGQYEQRLLCKGGGVKWLFFSAKAVMNTAGAFVGSFAMVTDISERKRAEEALQESERRLSSIYDTVADVIFHLAVEADGKYRFASVNHAFSKVTGLSEEMVVGKLVNEVIPEPSLSMVLGKYGRAIKENSVIRWEETSDYPTGRLTGDVSVAPVVDDTGRCTHLVGSVHDITERKRADIQIQYQANLLVNVSDAILATDRQFNIQYWNAAAEKQYGWTSGEVIGSHFLKFIQPQYIGDSRRTVMQKITQEGFWDGELLHNRRDGTLFPVQATISEVRNAEGQIVGHVAVNRDITEHKRAEERLRASEAYYKTLTEASPDAIIVADMGGAVAFASPKALEVFGAPPEAMLIGTSLLSWVSPEDQEIVKSRLQAIVSHRSPGAQREIRLLKNDRTPFWGDINSSPILDESRNVVGVLIVCRDISERKQAEQALRQSEARYRAVLQSANDAIVTADSNGNITGWNKGAERIFGFNYVEAVGQPLSRLMSASFRVDHTKGMKGLQSEADARIIGKTIEGKGVRKDGTEFPLELSLASWEVSEGQFYTAIIRDITERKRSETAVQESELRFRSVWNNSADGMRLTDRDGRILDLNDAFCRLVKIPREELLGQVFSMAYQREGPDDDLTLYQSRFDSGKTISDLLAKATLRSGETIDLEVTSSFIEIAGHEKMLLSLFRDITERKRAEAAVRESELRFRLVWNNSADGMRLTNDSGRTVDVNEAFCRLVQMTREQLIGEVFSKIYRSHGPSEGIEVYQERFASGNVVPRLAATIKLWSDDELDVEISNSFIDQSGGEKYLLSVFRDVTQRNKAEKRLEEERTLLRTIIDAIPDEIAVKDTERRFIVVNSGTVNAFKRTSADEIIGKKEEDFIPEQLVDQAIWEENAVLSVGGHARNRVSNKIDPETGEIERSLLISKIPLKDSEGKIIGVVGVNRDVTDLKRVEDMLEKERTLLLTLLESIPDEVCLKDLRHRYVMANAAAVKAFGATSPEALIGKTDRDFIPSAYVEVHFAEEDAILASGEPMINREQIRIKPDTGEIEKCVLTTKVPVTDQSGKTIGILVVNRNITDRKRAEEGLRASEEKFRSLFEESKDCIFISSADKELLDINPAGIEMFGYGSKEEVLRLDLNAELWDDSQQRVELYRRIDEQGFVKDFEATMKRKDGRKLNVLETAVSVPDKQGNIVMYRGTIRDVTRQRLLERQVGQAQKMESLGLLAGGIAHDFNNILGIILGHTAVVERAGKNPELLKDSVGEITTAVQRGASLVRQILTFARKSDAADEPIRVNATIRELGKMIDDTFPKTINLSLRLDKTIPIIMMDQTQLHQALLNLCVNARDAITDLSTGNLGRGEIMIQTSVASNSEVRKKFSEASAAEYVCIAVSDTGVGMNEETKQKIYEPFYTTKERGKGTGLGLSVVYGIIKSHHGHIEVESDIGHGTTFRLYLPVTDAVATPALPQEDGNLADIRGKETILLVEDEQNLLGLMKTALERAGYTVLTAMDGLSAIKAFSLNKEKIALVLTDLGLPKLDGAAVFTSLMEIDPNVKIILASGYLDPNLKSNLLRSGAKEFIQKPYSPNLVLRKIREVLDATA